MIKILKQFIILIILLSIFLTGAFIIQEQADSAKWEVEISQLPKEVQESYEYTSGKAELLGVVIHYSTHCSSSVLDYIVNWVGRLLVFMIPVMFVLWLIFLAVLKFLSKRSSIFLLSDINQIIIFFIIFVCIYLSVILTLTRGRIFLQTICF